MSIKIPVSAEFNSGDTEKQIQQFRQKLNELGQQVAQANKVKFEPVTKATVDDMRRVNQQFDALKRVSGDLNRRMKATGQQGAGLFDVDFSKLYPDAHSRNRQMAKVFQYSTGIDLGASAAKPKPGGGQSQGSRQTGPGIAHQAADAGLRAAGPAGGVAANSLRTGMSAGFGAGLMGLVGGMLALGVGKAVGAVMGKLETAEDNAVMYDRLKRVLGDVDVSFGVLKNSVEQSAHGLSMTFDEAVKLTHQFTKLGNVNDDDYRTVAKEMRAGAGLARAFGLDDGAGVSVLGTMRGMKATGNLEDTRRMALLIGETIGKSRAFAKSDEVMDALASYTQQQTRQSMGAANVGGFAGRFSAMVGSGIPGMDPTGAAGLLSRVNATLASGGAKGEASQFFTSMVGQRMGLDVVQTQLLREGGAFSTADETFGEGSMAKRYGIDGPSGKETFMDSSLKMLREKYGHDPGLLAKATSEHLGINMRQSMALLSIKPNQMGEVAAYAGDLTNLNERGIATLTRAVTGGKGDRKSIANELLGRTGDDRLSSADRDRLEKVMATGTDEEQKMVLADLVKVRDQEMTQGKAIRESKSALDNIKTMMADKLIPLTQNIRDGILYMAGDREMTGVEVLQTIAEQESNAVRQRIEAESLAKEEEATARFKKGYQDHYISARSPGLEGMQWWREGQDRIARDQKRLDSGDMSPDEQEEFEKFKDNFTNRIAKMAPSLGISSGPLVDLSGQLKSEKSAIRQDEDTAIQEEAGRLESEKARLRREYYDQQAANRRIQTEKDRIDERMGEFDEAGTSLPDGASRTGGEQRFVFDAAPIEIVHRNERGEMVKPSQFISTKVRPATPFGTAE